MIHSRKYVSLVEYIIYCNKRYYFVSFVASIVKKKTLS